MLTKKAQITLYGWIKKGNKEKRYNHCLVKIIQLICVFGSRGKQLCFHISIVTDKCVFLMFQMFGSQIKVLGYKDSCVSSSVELKSVILYVIFTIKHCRS